MIIIRIFSVITLLFPAIHYQAYTVLFKKRGVQLYGHDAMHIVKTDWWKRYMIDEDIEPIMLCLFLIMLSCCLILCYYSYKKQKGDIISRCITALPIVSAVLLAIVKCVFEPMWSQVL